MTLADFHGESKNLTQFPGAPYISTDIEAAYLQKNSIIVLDGEQFQGFTNLKYVDLSGNNFKCLQNTHHFRQVPIETLILKDQSAHDLGRSLLDLISVLSDHIVHLDLSANNLQGVLGRVYGNFCLQSLVLDNTSFETPELNDFLTSLKDCLLQLSMNNASVDVIDMHSSFMQLDCLTHLFLAENEIDELPHPMLMPKLKVLSLERNNLQAIETATLNAFPDLEYLDMSSNKLVAFPEGNDSLPRNLTKLKLKSNRLDSMGLLQNLHKFPKLESLDASSNRIYHFDCKQDTSTSQPLPELLLDLQKNRIHQLPRDLCGLDVRCGRPVTVVLEGNPINCSCSSINDMLACFVGSTITGQCSHPPKLKGHPFGSYDQLEKLEHLCHGMTQQF